MRLAQIGPEYQASESLSVTGTAGGFTAATVKDYTHAFVTCETGAVRFWLDGSTPTATAGHELFVGDQLELDSNDQIRSAVFISRDGGTCTLRCSFGR